jgi:hypothetical protein
MGWKLNQNPFTNLNDFMVYGNDIDGFAGKARIEFKNDQTYRFNVIP